MKHNNSLIITIKISDFIYLITYFLKITIGCNIFNTINSELEDGYYWLGLQKNSKNPFESNKNQNVNPVVILQEVIIK